MSSETVTPAALPSSATITGRLVLRCWLRGIRAIPTDGGLVFEPGDSLPSAVERLWLEQHRGETLAAQAAIGALGVVPSVSDDPAVTAAIETYRTDTAAMVAIANEYGAAKVAELKAATWWLYQLVEADGQDVLAPEITHTQDRIRKLQDELGVPLSRQAMAEVAALESKGD